MRFPMKLALVFASILLVIPASSASAKNTTLCYKAFGLREAVIKKHGKRAPGRNICRYGVQSKYNKKWSKPATTKQKAQYVRQLKRLLRPPQRLVARRGSHTVQAVNPRQSPAGTQTARYNKKWAIPAYIVMCESGGSYTARNPSGAYGAYQIMPGTARAYGCDLSTPSGQDRCAAKIYAREGAAPWVCG